ncbi:MAG TPA: helix-hairpin-helix domain-containing protein [Chitinophaga sp.]|uniref:helix-hairpin-helix domain-containing protein n=1 Tax=Chitinophaga sp. TaxID=1869181 RepID=UPI002CE15F91|nr:helix-hairpin-helix domain-containing protein [Chitinophaga sp.]HVI48808.1 helix-hairpin-helix domain-containing protein [Chitinophaga sp.]
MSETISHKQQVLKQLQTIPGIGEASATDLWNIGIRRVCDLRGQNPCTLYNRLNTVTGVTHDICMLYTFRCAVYYATEKHHDDQKLNWWYWKDKVYNEG